MAENKSLAIVDNKKQIVNIVQQENFKKQLAAALMSRLPEEYVVRSAMATINGNSAIQECTPLTVAASILLLAQAGIAPEPWKGHGYLVPRNIKISKKGEADRWEKQCTALIGYRGYINIAYKSPQVLKVGANVVYEGDIFDLDQVNGTVTHKPWIRPEKERKERGKIIGAYAFVKMKNGETLTEWMTRDDVDAVRGRSSASNYGPWVSDYAEMSRKTPLRRLFKWIPDPDLQRIAALEEASDYGNVAITIDGDTGEIVTRVVDNTEPEKPQVQMPQRQAIAKPVDTVSNRHESATTDDIIDAEIIEPGPTVAERFAGDEMEPVQSELAQGIFGENPKPETAKTPPIKSRGEVIGAGQARRIHAIASTKKVRKDEDFEELKTAFKIEHLYDFPKDRLPELEKWAEGRDFGAK